MVVPVMCVDVKTHEPIQLLQLAVVIRQLQRKPHQDVVIQIGDPVRGFQQRAGRNHMEPSPILSVKTSCREIPWADTAWQQPGLLHPDSAFLCAERILRDTPIERKPSFSKF